MYLIRYAHNDLVLVIWAFFGIPDYFLAATKQLYEWLSPTVRRILIWKQGKSEGFDSCNRPSNLTQIGFKSLIFQPVWPWNLMDDPEKQSGTSSMLLKAFCIIS